MLALSAVPSIKKSLPEEAIEVCEKRTCPASVDHMRRACWSLPPTDKGSSSRIRWSVASSPRGLRSSARDFIGGSASRTPRWRLSAWPAPRAAGGTLYVTLEPCCHHGKTPPCTKAILASGVGRVVVAMSDPFPQVHGGGIAELRPRASR